MTMPEGYRLFFYADFMSLPLLAAAFVALVLLVVLFYHLVYRVVPRPVLVALIAPRPVYIASALDDRWADPRGEFLSAQAAEPVYRLFGLEGPGESGWPAPDTPVGRTIRYHVRRGEHDLTRYDWDQFLDFTDRFLSLSARPGLGFP